MALEWTSELSTAVTALAGISATFFTARYNSSNNFRALEAERDYRLQQETLAERKNIYVRMLHSLEEFYFTLDVLRKDGYGSSPAADADLSEHVKGLLVRNLEVDLVIQNIERELELVAPLEVVKACRHTFYSLRELTHVLTDNGEIYEQPYNGLLAKAISLMRLDLQGEAPDLTTPIVEEFEKDIRAVFDLNAPASAIRLKLESVQREARSTD